jgi:dTDP-glucose pyrophosphorylase
MPMLGGGTRMSGLQNTCKPLIRLENGNCMFMQALRSLRNYEIDNLVLVVLREYEEQFWDLLPDIIHLTNCKRLYIKPNDPTRCPVETFLIGLSVVGGDLPIMCLDCDIYADIPVFPDTKHAGVFYFKDTNPNKSYIRTHYDYVTEIAEKNPISDKAVFGAYLFDDYNKLQEALQGTSVLCYISDIMKEMLLQGALIRSKQLNTVYNFGTLNELKKYGKQELQSISI